jgi:hypothetical protein
MQNFRHPLTRGLEWVDDKIASSQPDPGRFRAGMFVGDAAVQIGLSVVPFGDLFAAQSIARAVGETAEASRLFSIAGRGARGGVTLQSATEDVATYIARVQSRSARGPVLTGVQDTLTKEMFLGQNVDALPSKIHPMFQSKLDLFIGSVEDGSVVLNKKWGVPGAHSDF